MKRILTLLLLVATVQSWASKIDTCNYKKSDLVIQEVQKLVDSVKKQEGRLQYEVFVVRFYHIDPEKKDFSFTVGYILMSSEYKDLKPYASIEVSGRTVLIESDDDFVQELNDLKIKGIGFGDNIPIIQKLFPSDAGWYTDDSPEILTFSLTGCNITEVYFKNTNTIPKGTIYYSIYPKTAPIKAP